MTKGQFIKWMVILLIFLALTYPPVMHNSYKIDSWQQFEFFAEKPAPHTFVLDYRDVPQLKSGIIIKEKHGR